jgi:hypothetical protein
VNKRTTTVTAPLGALALSVIYLIGSGCASAPTEPEFERLVFRRQLTNLTR